MLEVKGLTVRRGKRPVLENVSLRLPAGQLVGVLGLNGAVGMGVISSIMRDDTYKELREALELGKDSKVLLFSTEGDTDPEKYKKIVWGGEYPTV